MGLIKFLKSKWDSWYYHDIDDDDYDWDEDEEYQEEKKAYDSDDIISLVLGALERMAEASERMESFKAEYDAVTGLLVDMEEIEKLPKEVKSDIRKQAEKIEKLEKQRREIFGRTTTMSDKEVASIEKHEEEIVSGISKIKEAEDYRKLVKADLKKLDGERSAAHYRKRELQTTIANTKGIASICLVAMVLCMILLMVLHFSYEMKVSIGFLIAGGLGAITLTVLYVKHIEAVAELKQLGKVINKLITVHNTVKIRYVNNTNLLSYLYMKYDVESSAELESRWEAYVEEANARQKDEKLKEELEYYYDKLTGLLVDNSIRDPEIWTHQAVSLYDSRETVEVRHALIARRQKLREQMEYNEKIAIEEQEKIKALGRQYPHYSKEIAKIVENYDEH